MGNLLDGIDVTGSSNNTIGGTDPGAGNLISANRDGIILQPYASNLSIGSNDNLIEGDYIGTDVTGTDALAVPLGNFEAGIYIANCSGNTIEGGQPPQPETSSRATRDSASSLHYTVRRATMFKGTTSARWQVAVVSISAGISPFISNLQGGIVIEDPGTTGNCGGGTAESIPQRHLSQSERRRSHCKQCRRRPHRRQLYQPRQDRQNRHGQHGSGVELDSFASGNTIGGATAAARNIISGNLASGIILQRAAFGNSVKGAPSAPMSRAPRSHSSKTPIGPRATSKTASVSSILHMTTRLAGLFPAPATS